MNDGEVNDGEVTATLALGPIDTGGGATGAHGHLEVVGDDHGVHARLVVTGPAGRSASAAGDGAVTALVEWWRAAGTAAEPAPAGQLRAAWAGEAAGEAADQAAPGVERQVSTDHANRSVATGQVLVKLLRQGAPDAERVLAPALHLRAVGFERVPTLLGSLTWEAGGDGSRSSPVLLALAHRYLADTEEGWGRFRRIAETALQGTADPGDHLGPVRALGQLTAAFHLAMATPSPVLPGPQRWSTAADHHHWHRWASELLDRAGVEVSGEAGRVLRAGRARLDRYLAPLAVTDPATPLLWIHGDLHVGQILTADGQLYLTDLDGDPSAEEAGGRRPASPARDVAAVLRSLDHVGRLAAQRLGPDRGPDRGRRGVAAADAWIVAARRSYLDTHIATLEAAGRRDLLDDRLVAPFEAAQVGHELRYATRWLPEWLPVATEAMRALLDGRVTAGR